VCPLLAAVASAWIALVPLQGSRVASDENAYLFQAHAYLDGVLARPAPALGDALAGEMQIVDPAVGWTGRYPPGHALWLLPGALLDAPRLMSAASAALGILLIGLTARRLGASEVLVHALLLISPYYLFMHATLLSHTSSLVAVSAMLLLYLRWDETGRARHAAGAGACWSFLFLSRPYTAALLAVPFAIDAVAALLRSRAPATWRGVAILAGAAACGVLGLLGFNLAVTGDPLLPPHLYYAPSERLGFGTRMAGARLYEHTPAAGLEILRENLRLLDRWLLGFRGPLLVAAPLAILGWSRRWSPLLVGGAVVLPLGYVAFFFRGVREIGPVYYFEALAFLVPLLALGLTKVLCWMRARHRLLVPAALALALLGSLRFMAGEIEHLAPAKRYEARVRATIEAAPPGSLVLLTDIPYEPFLEHLVLNRRGLASERLVAESRPEWDAALLRAYAYRVPYRITAGAEEELRPIDR